MQPLAMRMIADAIVGLQSHHQRRRVIAKLFRMMFLPQLRRHAFGTGIGVGVSVLKRFRQVRRFVMPIGQSSFRGADSDDRMHHTIRPNRIVVFGRICRCSNQSRIVDIRFADQISRAINRLLDACEIPFESNLKYASCYCQTCSGPHPNANRRNDIRRSKTKRCRSQTVGLAHCLDRQNSTRLPKAFHALSCRTDRWPTGNFLRGQRGCRSRR